MPRDRCGSSRDVNAPVKHHEPIHEFLWPADIDSSSGERAAEERPVRVDETEDAVHGHGGNELLYKLDLTEHAVDELRVVASHDELLDRCRNRPPSICSRGRLLRNRWASTTHVPAREDHMVDVRPGAGNTPTVQQGTMVRSDRVER